MVLVPGLVAAVCMATDTWSGPALFGTVVMLPQAFGQVAQLRDLVVSRDVAGVSAGFMVTNLVVQLLWLTWALWVGDHAVLVAAGTMAVVVALNCLAWLARRTRAAERPRVNLGRSRSPGRLGSPP